MQNVLGGKELKVNKDKHLVEWFYCAQSALLLHKTGVLMFAT